MNYAKSRDLFMKFLRKKPFLWGTVLVLGLVILPATVFFIQNEEVINSHAEKTVNLSYSPNSTASNSAIQVPAGNSFSLDIYVDPGANSVSFVKLEMVYDPTKFQLAGGFVPNLAAFSQVVDGPIDTSGKETITLSIGSDLSKAIKTKTKIGSLILRAISTVPPNTTSVVSFGAGSQALSVSGNSSFDENVIASTTPVTIEITKSLSCGNAPSDSMLLMDTSDSMNNKIGTSSATKLTAAKSSAKLFVNLASTLSTNRVALATFDSGSTLKSGYTNNFTTVKNDITGLTTKAGTCMQCGIDTANKEIAAHKRTGIKNAIVLLTDGRANWIEGGKGYVSNAIAEKAAMDAAAAGHKANGTVIYAIGLGDNVFSDFLKQLAESTGGKYYFSPTTDQLNSIYTQISQELSGGSISGMVFKVPSNIDTPNAAEATPFSQRIPFPGVLVSLYSATISASKKPLQTTTTGSDGTYSIDRVCDGFYALKQSIPAGWKQILPQNINGYTLTMKNGNALTNEDFADTQIPPSPSPSQVPSPSVSPTCILMPSCKPGFCTIPRGNYCPPSPTPNPKGKEFSLTVFMHGIGNSGDNANPTEFSLSNKNPQTPERHAFAELFNAKNILVATASGTIHYSSASGNFSGNVSTSTQVPDGKYTIKIGSTFHLIRLITGIQNLTTSGGVISNQAGGKHVYPLPAVTLVAGDADQNDKLNILDYNMLLDCYSDLLPAVACDGTKKTATDFNDDGSVNQYDYNLFLREISTQPGD